MAYREYELMLFMDGVTVSDTKIDYGMSYKFYDRDNRITLELTEFSIEEFHKFSSDLDDYEEYDLIMSYNKDAKKIVGYDWEIKLGEKRPNIRHIYKTIELLGQRYDRIHMPDILIYQYDDERMHKSYIDWIEVMGYKLRYADGLAIYNRESKYDIQE